MPTKKFNIRADLANLLSTRDQFAAATSVTGQQWIRTLPDIAADVFTAWGLALDGEPMHGYLGVVLPVRQGTERLALKLSQPSTALQQEAEALAAWAGNGAVHLIDVDTTRGALLLERLDGQTSLTSAPLAEAVAVAGALARRLAIAAPAGICQQATFTLGMIDDMQQRYSDFGRNIPSHMLDKAIRLATQLAQPNDNLLINYDLHYGNILAGDREAWLVIDPKVIAGDKAFGIAQLLWTRYEIEQSIAWRFAALTESAEIDYQHAAAWSFVRVIDYWLWATSVGFTEDPLRCQAIATWLDSTT